MLLSSDGQASDKLRNQSETEQIFRLHSGECFGETMRASLHFGMEAERLVAQSSLDHFLESDESATTNEENVSRVDREELLVRVLATTLRRNVRNRAFENFQKRLLHAFTGDVTSDRR